jgi:cell wall-associated NlpC family hydrolase
VRIRSRCAVLLLLSLNACALWQGGGPDRAEESARRAALSDFHSRWRGVPYRNGGAGPAGFDCSGLVHAAYREVFGMALPRTTEDQALIGHRISRSELRAGDLIFFKTGWGKRHVGVYLDDGRFLHASESEGVTLSSLASPYWDSRFWHARRLL